MPPVDLSHETLRLDRSFGAPLARLWQAYAETATRSLWGVPAGEEMVFERDDLRTGGLATYRCGPPGRLSFRVETEYLVVEPEHLVVHTETVHEGDHPLATGLLSWEFRERSGGSAVAITHQIASFTGQGMIDGSRNGHGIALAQLAALLEA